MDNLDKVNPKLKIFFPVVRGLAKILGKDYEVNLHDVSMLEHSLVLCENGYVTGRMPGGPMTDFGLFMLQSEQYKDKDGVYNYLAKNNRGELIKCSAMFIRDEDGKIIGFLCINYDIKKAVAARELIDSLLHLDMQDLGEFSQEPGYEPLTQERSFPAPMKEWFAKDLDDVVIDALAQVKEKAHKPLSEMNKAEKKEVIRELRDKGFFRLKSSVEKVAQEMGNTKYTIYSYIRAVEAAEEEK